LALTVAGSVFSLGCEALIFAVGNDHARGAEHGRGRDYGSGAYTGNRLGDVNGVGRSSIPEGAGKVWEGTSSEQVTYGADRDGQLYVLDLNSDRVVYRGAVRRDDQLVLDLAAGRADLNGRPMASTRLVASHTYSVFFRPD
jgi:hypothetical protein